MRNKSQGRQKVNKKNARGSGFTRAPQPQNSRNQDSLFGAKNGSRISVGIHSVKEAFKVRPKAITKIRLKSDWNEDTVLGEIAEMAQSNGLKIESCSTQQLDRLCHGHQGVAIEINQSPEIDWLTVGKGDESEVFLVLDNIVDPQNLGAILRTAWLIGVDGIFISKNRAVGLTPTACKVASGGAEHVPVEVCTNLASTVKTLKDRNFWVYGLSEKAQKSIYDCKYDKKIVWVVGSEGKGIRKPILDLCDEKLAIPQTTQDASLNASVSLAIALSESRRRE